MKQISRYAWRSCHSAVKPEKQTTLGHVLVLAKMLVFLLLSLNISMTLQSAHAAAEVPTTPDEVRKIVRAAVQRAALPLSVLVDPQIEEEITASVIIFTSNFCYPPDAQEAISLCDRTVNSSDVMDSVIFAYLQELMEKLPARLDTVGARLARVVGMDFGMVGWPSDADNAAAVIDVGDDWREATFSLQAASGPLELGAGGKAIILNPGYVTLIGRQVGGDPISYGLQVAARTRTAFQPTEMAATHSAGIGRIEPAPSLFCYSTMPSKFEDSTTVFNWGRGRFVEDDSVRLSNQAPFTRQMAIDIHVANEANTGCGEECLIGLGTAFAQAIAVWRGGCERCDPNALSIISVGSGLWLDWRLANRLRKSAADPQANVSLNLIDSDASEMLKLVSPPTASVPQTSIVSYEEISDNTEIGRLVCSLPQGTAPWMQDAQSFLCPDSPSPERVLSPTLTLKPGATQCGPPEQFIACGLPGGDVEITTDSARYKLPSVQGTVMISTPEGGDEFDLTAIILHEVGHWFGVPHAEEAGPDAILDIMSKTYGDGELCASAQAMLMMNNASDVRWPYRVTEGSGLRRPSATFR